MNIIKETVTKFIVNIIVSLPFMVKAEANIKVYVGHLGCQVANVSTIQTESVVGHIYINE